MQAITLTVSNQMSLTISRSMLIGYDGDQNSIAFNIIQPKHLNKLNCRAEIEMGGIKTWVTVSIRTFTLPPAVADEIGIQLVYTNDSGETVAKTSVVTATIGDSINAADPSNPGFLDGLAQIQAAIDAGKLTGPPGEVGFLQLSINDDGHLIHTYSNEDIVPNLFIADDGHLYATVS